jgi:hypothetical protein
LPSAPAIPNKGSFTWEFRRFGLIDFCRLFARGEGRFAKSLCGAGLRRDIEANRLLEFSRKHRHAKRETT